MVLRGTLLGGTDLRYTDVAFSRDGARVAAFGNRTDHLATVWNVKKSSTDEEELTGEKVSSSPTKQQSKLVVLPRFHLPSA